MPATFSLENLNMLVRTIKTMGRGEIWYSPHELLLFGREECPLAHQITWYKSERDDCFILKAEFLPVLPIKGW